jgi:glucosamine-6-phosphate deaminase
MRIIIEDNAEAVAAYAAAYIKDRINKFQPGPNKYFVIGLPTGGTPVKTYKKLIEYVESFRSIQRCR